MKLYATVESEGKGREARKGGNKELVIKLTRGNSKTFTVVFKEHTLLVYNTETYKILYEENLTKGKMQNDAACDLAYCNGKDHSTCHW